MNELRQNFLAESVKKLEQWPGILREEPDEAQRRELFRVVHTIKGGLQTFGFKNAARLAEEIENLLSERNLSAARRSLLVEGVRLLAAALDDAERHAPPAEFIDRLRDSAPAAAAREFFVTRIPPAVFRSFSKSEQKAALAAMRRGDAIFCLEVGFEPADFAAEYRELRKVLNEKGELIAALPSPKHAAARKVGFRIFLATRENPAALTGGLAGFAIDATPHDCADQLSHELFEMLSQIAAHGEEIGRRLEKDVGVTILANETNIPAATAAAVFDILLQLVRNAVAHAVDKRGRIEIRIFDEPAGLSLTVEDDGRGIDLEMVRARAVERNLIAPDAPPDDETMLGLIFAPGISTAPAATGISGRGVGLDAVKSRVERLNGKISVKSRINIGTKFEIFLPKS
ncbi:MAG: Hpt domain-containing protein [Acidobacteria bacterium]|nr:Hpt domain-containing protein [Acidobacteriota bacterium]